MQQIPSLTRLQFEHALTPAGLRITQIIQSAIMGGVVLFAIVMVLIFENSPRLVPSSNDTDAVQKLTMIQLFFAVIAPILGFFLAQRVFSPERLPAVSGVDSEAIASQCVVLQRTAVVMRMAIMEGAAFFGLAVCTIAATNGVLASDGTYWINLLSTGILLAAGIATFPSKDFLVAWFEKNFLAM